MKEIIAMLTLSILISPFGCGTESTTEQKPDANGNMVTVHTQTWKQCDSPTCATSTRAGVSSK